MYASGTKQKFNFFVCLLLRGFKCYLIHHHQSRRLYYKPL
jgi:hypothetical protein